VGQVLETLGGKLGLMMLTSGLEEWAAIQWERNIWENCIFYGHMVVNGGEEKGSGDHVGWEIIFSDCVETSGGDLLLLIKIYIHFVTFMKDLICRYIF
jgi:hypothetical protein